MQIITNLIAYLETLNDLIVMFMLSYTCIIDDYLRKHKKKTWDTHSRHLVRGINFDRVVFLSNLACVENTRMDMRSFHSLCHMLKVVG